MPTPSELNAFHQLQKIFAAPSLLHHFDWEKALYVDLDASKEFGFAAHVYHSTDKAQDPAIEPKQKSKASIIFLSRLLTDAESKFQSSYGFSFLPRTKRLSSVLHMVNIEGDSDGSFSTRYNRLYS